jgi:ATP-dependent DNA helicase RecQ
MDVETFDRTAEKLVAQGAAAFDIAGNLRATENKSWQSGYDQQLAFRRAQIDQMARFAETPQCRMAALIQHFGDTADGLRPCGHCDFCSPERAQAQTFRQPTQQEDRQLRTILRALDGAPPRATGKLHTDLALGIDRKTFDTYLNALTRAGLITLTTDTFTNPEGNVITFKRASLTHEGRNLSDDEPLAIHLTDTGAEQTGAHKASRKAKTPSTSRRASKETAAANYTPEQKALDQRLREWRKAEAAKTSKPAFIVFSDAVLQNIVHAQPQTITELNSVSGIGSEKSDRYGAAVIAICRGSEATNNAHTPSSNRSSRTKREATSGQTPVFLPDTHKHQPGGNTSEQQARPATPQAAPTLTPDQQTLDTRLRAWRAAEAERLGLPQFFVLGTSVLRTIAVERPRTLTELKMIDGVSLEKAEKFGGSILAICAE